MEKSLIYKIGRAGFHGAKKLLTFPKAFREYSVFKKEFGPEIAKAQFREQLFHYNVGYNDRYIKIASGFMADELKPVIEKYKSGEFVQYQGKYDFHGKTPVWVCWWQGYENMPPIVKCCYDRIEKTYSEDFCVVLITKENYREYIDLPGIIPEKFEKSMMSIQHFADVMRWGLMAHYGGIWFDATIFLSYDSPGAVAWQRDMPFFTQRFADESDCPNEPCRGKWSGFFFMGKHSPDVRIFQFVYDSALYYWEKHNMAFHYVWPDYVLWTGYSELDDLRRLIDSVPPNNTNIWGMKLNDTYSEEKMEKLMRDNEFYKLTYKKKLKTRDRKGNLTIYGYLINLHAQY